MEKMARAHKGSRISGSPAHRLRRRAVLGASLGLGFAPPARARIQTLGEAIDKAGAQRMLSQRMGKAWLGQVHPELADRARSVLQGSVERFERQLGELLAFAPVPHIAISYKALESRFAGYRKLLQATPQRERVNELLATSGEVLALADAATAQLQDRSRAATAKLVNVSGRQRMLSQRLALFFLAHQQGARPELVRREMTQARAEFEAGMRLLEAAPEAVPAIRENLQIASNQWLFLQSALAGRSEGDKAASNVFVASENLLAVMETVTGQFARQLA
ncbi:MAG: hypothetical protein EOP39_07150 [Rubrivivax sp.]|nr:MAG: hypothetical protein EOP39_07150 [Rubrivivax sp.]